jgi:hypothetical protein
MADRNHTDADHTPPYQKTTMIKTWAANLRRHSSLKRLIWKTKNPMLDYRAFSSASIWMETVTMAQTFDSGASNVWGSSNMQNCSTLDALWGDQCPEGKKESISLLSDCSILSNIGLLYDDDGG